jgi:hypothetical protein
VGTISYGSKTLQTDVYVLEGLAQPLLSRDACMALGIFEDKRHT